MKLLLILLPFLLLSCGKAPSVAGGGDDFPSMISIASEQIAVTLNGQNLADNPPAVSPSIAPMINPRSRAITISGDTLIIDTMRIIDGDSAREYYYIPLESTSSIYKIKRIQYGAKGVDTLIIADADGDGKLFSPAISPMSIRIHSFGTNRGQWWYRGVDKDHLDLKRFAVQSTGGSIEWYRPNGDSLAEEGDTVFCRIANALDSIELNSIAVGNAANLENDLIISLSLRTFRKGTALFIAVTPDQPTRYRTLFDKGTLTVTAVRQDSTLVCTGQFDDKTISITDGSGKRYTFDRAGKSLERGTL